MDFCCTDSYSGYSTYGTSLVNEIVRHNFLVKTTPAVSSSNAKTGIMISSLEGLDDATENAEATENVEAESKSAEVEAEEVETSVSTLQEENTDEQESAAIYDLEGHRVTELQPGLNIVRFKNGTVKKIYK